MQLQLGEPRTNKRNLTLLPLIDVIFLLLIFFMFSSNLSPFSMLPLTRDRAEAAPEIQAASIPQAAPTLDAGQIDIMVMVGADSFVRVNGKPVRPEALRSEFDALRLGGAENLVIAPSRAASVQALVRVLEAAKQSAIPSVAIRQ